ncbi:NUDIX hydrolase [Candidatus Woesearchaeota archaeon]|nr:NUDIX hydrolase [Candidatus Woesearchaeota archaeon]
MKTKIEKERKEIFKLFLKSNKLKFAEIEKLLKIRSNFLAYYLKNMQKDELIDKKGDYYCLNKNAEKYLPVLSQINDVGPLPVILVGLINENKILLMKRKIRPYKDYYGLIGGKIKIEEDFKEASLRIIKEKTSLSSEFISLNSVFHERVLDKIVKHSFILFFSKLKTSEIEFKESSYGSLKWFDLDNLKGKIIPSDLWLIQNKLNSKIDVKSAFLVEKNGKYKLNLN